MKPGDNLWDIAAATVAATGPTASVPAYWESLIAANRSRLPDPANPGLIFAGEVLVLPPVA